MTNDEYLEKIYDVLDEWSVLDTKHLEDFWEAMQEVNKRLALDGDK